MHIDLVKSLQHSRSGPWSPPRNVPARTTRTADCRLDAAQHLDGDMVQAFLIMTSAVPAQDSRSGAV
jgi:hypothetical protein